MNMSVFEMVHQVLGDAKKKMASDASSAGTKTKAAAVRQSHASTKVATTSTQYLNKLADACDFLADHIGEVVDTRTPQEKLAELEAVQAALYKKAFEVGGNAPKDPSLAGYKGEGDKGEHQDEEAEGASIPPVTPPLDDGAPNPGGPNSAMVATPAMTPGAAPEGGDLGEASSGNQPPKAVTPNESAYPTAPANSLETNKDMMMASQPEDVLKQALAVPGALTRAGEAIRGAGSKALGWAKEPVQALTEGRKIRAAMGGAAGKSPGILRDALDVAKAYPGQTAAAVGTAGVLGAGGVMGGKALLGGDKEVRANAILNRVTGQDKVATRQKLAKAKKAAVLLQKAAQSGIPKAVALNILGLDKQAEDALFPAQISAGTEPVLQSDPGTPSALMQGSEAGVNTPRETAPNSGEGAGRELLSSNEAAINATKGQAKRQNKGALSEILSEPAMSAGHDRTLQETLDNTSSAGVKISAAREMIRKFASKSPENARKVRALAKLAEEGGIPMAPEAAMAEEAPAEAGPMEAALQAAASGVTPEDVAQAHELLAAVGEGGEMGEPGEAPEAGLEDTEKQEQFGAAAPGGGGLGGPGAQPPMPQAM
jgi:hypothetical protein